MKELYGTVDFQRGYTRNIKFLLTEQNIHL